MFEDLHFLRETIVDINAAVIGICSERWTGIPDKDASIDQAATIMRDNRFDILPINGASGVREYFQTAKWNDFSIISRVTITHRDVLHLPRHSGI